MAPSLWEVLPMSDPVELTVTNRDDRFHEVHVTVVPADAGDDPDRAFGEVFLLDPGESERVDAAFSRVDRYELRVRLDDGAGTDRTLEPSGRLSPTMPDVAVRVGDELGHLRVVLDG